MDSLLIAIVSIIALFSYLAVEAWADARRREQEAIAFLVAALTGTRPRFQNGLAKNATERPGGQSH
jgi:hypothetical protein